MSTMNDICLLRLSVSRVGVDRKVDGSDMDEAMGRSVDKARVKMTKRLVTGPEIKACNRCCNEAGTIVAKRCVPAPWVAPGFAMIAVDRYPMVVEDLTALRSTLALATETLASVWADRVVESQVELTRNGIPWDASEWPTVDEVRSGFSIAWRPLEFQVPAALERIDAAAFQEAKQAAETQWASALEEGEKLLASEMKKLVDHMVEKLTPETDASGRPVKKIYRDSLVDNLREFLAEFPFRNLTNSAELEELTKQATAVLGGLSAEALRLPSMSDAREAVAMGMAEVSRALEEAIVTAPKRRILTLPPAATAEEVASTETAAKEVAS